MVVLHVSRDGRYNVPKTSSSRGDEQQRMQPYNQMLSNRAISQSNMSIPGAVPGGERGVRVLPGGNGLGMNTTTMPVAGPGFTRMASSPMLNSSSMLSSPMAGAQSPVNMHAGSGVTQVRPRESIHVAGVSVLSFSLTDHFFSSILPCGSLEWSMVPKTSCE